jgi:hypothetical protein
MACKTQLNRLFILQKKAVRIVFGAPFHEHTAPLFFASRILPLDMIIVQAKLLFMHSIKYEYCPKSFYDVFTRNNIVNPVYELRYPIEFVIPFARTELFKKVPLYSLPDEWNNCGDLRFYVNPTTFKIILNETLFNKLALDNRLISE